MGSRRRAPGSEGGSVGPARPSANVPCGASLAPYLAVLGSPLKRPVSCSGGGVYVCDSGVSVCAASPSPIS